MPRPRKPAPHPSIGQAVESLVLAIGGLVSTVGAAVHSAREVGSATKDVKTAVKKGRGPGKGNPKLKAALKRYWAKMKGKARKSRIAKMLAGRGLKAKGAATRKPNAKRAAKSKGGAWASMTPEQRAERVARMQAGRGAKAQRA
jgi:hypothetical protein